MNLLCILFCFLAFAFSSFAKAKTEERILSPSDKKPLVLLWMVSHPRNTDQIGLIFRKKSVELITNTSSYQEGRMARLGRFKSPLTPELKDLKAKVNRYYNQAKRTVPLSSLFKDSRLPAGMIDDPHAPILFINKERIDYQHDYFKPLSSIIYKIWKHKWLCMKCAIYTQEKESVLRVVKARSKGKKRKQLKKTSEQRIPKKLLDCSPRGKRKVECVDPQFGIFKI